MGREGNWQGGDLATAPDRLPPTGCPRAAGSCGGRVDGDRAMAGAASPTLRLTDITPISRVLFLAARLNRTARTCSARDEPRDGRARASLVRATPGHSLSYPRRFHAVRRPRFRPARTDSKARGLNCREG